MAQIISNSETQKVADLIKIKIPEKDLPHYTEQLNTVLNAVPVLGELDTDNVPITAQTHGMTNVFRDDVPQPSLDMQQYKNTQNFQNSAFVVDKVLQST